MKLIGFVFMSGALAFLGVTLTIRRIKKTAAGRNLISRPHVHEFPAKRFANLAETSA